MSNQEEEIKARDEQAEEFEDWYLQRGYYYDLVEKKTILNALNLQREDIVLDAGCGTGRFTRLIAKKCRKVYGVDFSPKSIEVLNKKAREEGIQNIETYVCDITKSLPIKEKVDKIVSIQVIQHIPTEVGRYTAVLNLYDKLKSGGTCVISVSNWNLLSKRRYLKEEKSSNFYHLRFTPKEIASVFKKCGFKHIIVTGCINFRGYAFLNNYRFHKVFYPVAELDTFLSRFKFSRSLGSFLVCKGLK